MYRAKPGDGVAWITGASSGIGRALARHLAGDGFRVAATARDAAALNELAAGTAGIVAYPADVTDAAAMRTLVAIVEEREGPITLAVLNAGVYDPSEREAFDAAAAWRTVEINLGGAIRCAAPVLDTMRRRGRGQIAFTASLAGYGGIPGSLAYGASKAALINLAEGLHLTLRSSGIAVQVINPGFVRTPMTAVNDYPMPFMVEAETAARRIADGLRAGSFEITFPRRLAWAAKGARLLPYPLWMTAMARASRRVGAKAGRITDD